MGFKTVQWPCVEVLRSSGEPCLQFQEKSRSEQVESQQGAAAVSSWSGGFSRKV